MTRHFLRDDDLTPAEQAALNGHHGFGAPLGASVNPGDPSTEAEIDAAARAGAPAVVDDTPVTQIIQVPDGGRVDP